MFAVESTWKHPMAKSYASAIAAAFFCVTLTQATIAAENEPGLLKFEVVRGDKVIGEHTLTFNQISEDTLEITIDIDLEVKVGPFTVFDYIHRNATVWRDGGLQRMRSTTDDNGEGHNVAIDLAIEHLQIEPTGGESFTAARNLLPTTYWMASTITQQRLINSQTGEILEVKVQEVGRETVPGPDGPISATRFRMDGDLEIELWYDDNGILASLAFSARGSDITYRLIERRGLLSMAAAMPKLTARN